MRIKNNKEEMKGERFQDIKTGTPFYLCRDYYGRNCDKSKLYMKTLYILTEKDRVLYDAVNLMNGELVCIFDEQWVTVANVHIEDN